MDESSRVYEMSAEQFAQIRTTLANLPYSGRVTDPAALTSVESLANWLECYRRVIARESAHALTLAEEAAHLRSERATVRAFFGVVSD